MTASMLSRTIGFSNAMSSSRAACSSGYSLKNASTHLVLTFAPLGSEMSSRVRSHASAIAELTRETSCLFASIGSPGGTRKLQIGRIGRPASPSTLICSAVHSRRKTRLSGIMYAWWTNSPTLLASFFLISAARPDGRSRYATGILILLPVSFGDVLTVESYALCVRSSDPQNYSGCHSDVVKVLFNSREIERALRNNPAAHACVATSTRTPSY